MSAFVNQKGVPLKVKWYFPTWKIFMINYPLEYRPSGLLGN